MTDEPTVAALRAEIARKERDAGVLQAFTAELNSTLVLDRLLSIVLHTVNEVFGFDPSTRDKLVTRTMKQAIFMMNNDQLHRLINASPDEDTMLSRLVHSESDNRVVLDVLYVRVLARRPTNVEREILLRHIESVQSRGKAFEDILWSLLNSAEFTTRN